MAREETTRARFGSEVEQPGDAPGVQDAIGSASAALLAAAEDPSLGEDLALTLLRRRDLVPQILERVSKNAAAIKHRSVKVAVVEHPATPRHVALALLRHLFPFELMQISLAPAVSPDIKAAADQALIGRLEAVSLGERITLARRASGNVAAALLADSELRVIEATLENPRLTEALICKVLARIGAPAALVEAVCRHPKWSAGRDVRATLLRSEHMPAELAMEFSRSVQVTALRDILHVSRLPEELKMRLEKDLAMRTVKRERSGG